MTENFKILLDTPAEGHLALGFNDLAKALADVIQGSDPRFAVGLFGGWGSGKTTLMHAIEACLDRNRCIPVRFSAWRYEKEEHLIVPLLDVVREGLVIWADQRKSRAKRLSQTALEVADTVGKSIYSLVAGFSLKAGVPNGAEISFDANKALSKGEQLAKEAEAARVPRSFYHASFGALSEAFLKFTGKEEQRRIVVFVDDLDRCLAEGALEVLESMKLFFDLPGFVFVVGLDRRIVELSVDRRYKDLQQAEGDQTGLVSGTQYLKKIFQVPYSLAPVAASQIGDFLTTVQSTAKLPDSQWEEIQAHLRPHLRFLTGESGVNPREIKRYINSYTLVRKTRPWLNRDIVLALQTIAFRSPEWDRINLALLTFREIFIDALRRHEREPTAGYLDDLDPDLSLAQSFLDFISANAPGRALLEFKGPIDEFIYSGEATRSSEGTAFLSLFREMGGLMRIARNAEFNDGAFELGTSRTQTFEETGRKALRMYKKARRVETDSVTRRFERLLNLKDFKSLPQPSREAFGVEEDIDALKEVFEEEHKQLLGELRQIMRDLQEIYKGAAL
jgi:hypothetical protein